jgi:hypothetical protein
VPALRCLLRLADLLETLLTAGNLLGHARLFWESFGVGLLGLLH